MHPPSSNFLLSSLLVKGALSDFLGPRFQAPVDFVSDNSEIISAWKRATSVFDSYFDGTAYSGPPSLNGLENLTFSAGMSSVHDASAQSLHYHHTSQEVVDGPGTDLVDSDSIYRLASVSKLFSVYAGLIEFEDEQWDRPLTDFIPGLSSSTLKYLGGDNIRHIQWEQVTLRALASQISGVSREAQPLIQDLAILPDLITGAPVPNLTTQGLPPANLTDPAAAIPCLADPEAYLKDPLTACPADLYFDGAVGRPPTFEAWTTPAYANNGFTLFGIALANITGKPLAQVYEDAIFNPLGMTNSKSVPPPKSEWSSYVVPETGTTQWAQQAGLTISSGGLFSSLNDLAKLGTAILNSTLLPKDTTRRWLKPVSHTASLDFSVGAPWEIYRYTHDNAGAVTDIYTKLGDSGDFTSYAVLIPDYDAGFNIIAASTNQSAKSNQVATIADIITIHMLPALEKQAQVEAKQNFAASYKSRDASLNSSMTISFIESASDPGLYITSWISNGTDMMTILPVVLGQTIKLQPSISQPGQRAFRTVSAKPKPAPESFPGPFSQMLTTNRDWLTVDALTYGGIGLSLFVFDVDADGKAASVSAAAWRAVLRRE